MRLKNCASLSKLRVKMRDDDTLTCVMVCNKCDLNEYDIDIDIDYDDYQCREKINLEQE